MRLVEIVMDKIARKKAMDWWVDPIRGDGCGKGQKVSESDVRLSRKHWIMEVLSNMNTIRHLLEI